MMRSRPVYVTKQGLTQLKEELHFLQNVKLPETIDRLHEAKSGSDWLDSSEFMLVEEEAGFISARIEQLEYMLDQAELIELGDEDNIVDIGETVVVQAAGAEVERYTIVGVAETDPARGFISNESPLGRSLLKHKVGDVVTVETPGGAVAYTIIAISR